MIIIACAVRAELCVSDYYWCELLPRRRSAIWQRRRWELLYERCSHPNAWVKGARRRFGTRHLGKHTQKGRIVKRGNSEEEFWRRFLEEWRMSSIFSICKQLLFQDLLMILLDVSWGRRFRPQKTSTAARHSSHSMVATRMMRYRRDFSIPHSFWISRSFFASQGAKEGWVGWAFFLFSFLIAVLRDSPVEWTTGQGFQKVLKRKRKVGKGKEKTLSSWVRARAFMRNFPNVAGAFNTCSSPFCSWSA